MKQPPSLDDQLTKNAIETLKLAPLLLLCNGYWMLSNKQIFDNEVSPIDDSASQMKSEHSVGGKITAASPMLLVAVAAIFLRIIQKVFSEQLQRWGFTMSSSDI